MIIFNAEIKKLYREKTTVLIFILLVILTIVPFALGSGHNEGSNIEVYESTYQMTQATIKTLSSDPTATEVVNDMKESNLYLKEMIDGMKEHDTSKALASELKYERKNLEDMKKGSLNGIPIVEQEKSVAVLDYLVSNNMTKKHSNPFKLGAINYFETLYSTSQFITIFFVLLSVFIAFSFTSDGLNRSISIYNMSPYSMTKLYWQKFIALYLTVILGVGIVFLLIFAIIAFKNGLGNSHYPIALLTGGEQVHLISSQFFVFKNLVFMNSWLLFLIAISALVSLLSHNLVLNLFILFTPILLHQYGILDTLISKQLSPFLITSYVDTSHVILGGDGFSPLSNNKITFSLGMLLLLISTIIMVLFSLTVLRKRNRNIFL